MLESMTGASRSSVRIDGEEYSFFLKSVNHRFLEVLFFVPDSLLHLEEPLGAILRKHIPRGRVEVRIESSATLRTAEVDQNVLRHYLRLLDRESPRRGRPERGEVLALMQLPGVITLKNSSARLSMEEISRAFEKGVLQLKKARLREGELIRKLFTGFLKDVEREVRGIEKRIGAYRKELLSRFKSELALLGPAGEISEEKVLSGFLEWFDRFNIAEEIDRLRMHTAALRSLMRDEEEPGKRIDFFAQEMLREANTIGSKSRDFEMRKRVVEIKSVIEKIKEQVRNIC